MANKYMITGYSDQLDHNLGKKFYALGNLQTLERIIVPKTPWAAMYDGLRDFVPRIARTQSTVVIVHTLTDGD